MVIELKNLCAQVVICSNSPSGIITYKDMRDIVKVSINRFRFGFVMLINGIERPIYLHANFVPKLARKMSNAWNVDKGYL